MSYTRRLFMGKERNYAWLKGLARMGWIGFFILLLLGFTIPTLTGLVMSIALVLAPIAIYLNAIHYAHTSEKMNTFGWALITIKLLASSLFFLFGVFTGGGMVALTVFLIIPFVALIVGVQGAFQLMKNGSKLWSLLTFIIAIAPFILVSVLIFLTQSGIVVISFM